MKKFTYEECKRLDVYYRTPINSPLHRKQRFPEEWKKEVKGERL